MRIYSYILIHIRKTIINKYGAYQANLILSANICQILPIPWWTGTPLRRRSTGVRRGTLLVGSHPKDCTAIHLV